MKILVAIANYGTKNVGFLRTIIKEYQSMSYRVDIVVLSNIPKELGPGIEVKIGLCSKNPWSLPFGHKKIFAKRLEDYDLFIYSEDDILITRENIESFLQLTKVVPEDNICGFLRYELDSTGKKWYPDFRGPYHWLPKSVNKKDQFTVAEFSNAHSACYILTRDQLRRAINSGGYLVEPHQGRYDLLCSAATDPYTQCGLKKVICISHIFDMLVHHLSNRYVGHLGIDENDFDRQIAFMLSTEYGGKARQELFITTKNIDSVIWDKLYFDNNNHDLSAMVSQKAKNILSVGWGYPFTEATLVQDNHTVTAIPLDPIVGTLAASRGIKVMEPNFEKAFHDLKETQFDCIIFSDVLQHLKNPLDILSRAVKLLAPDGELLISIPNFKYLKFLKDHFPYPFFKRWTYSKNYLQMVDKNHLTKWFRSIGVNEIDFKYVDGSQYLNQHLNKLRPFLEIAKVLFTKRLLAKGKKALSSQR